MTGLGRLLSILDFQPPNSFFLRKELSKKRNAPQTSIRTLFGTFSRVHGGFRSKSALTVSAFFFEFIEFHCCHVHVTHFSLGITFRSYFLVSGVISLSCLFLNLYWSISFNICSQMADYFSTSLEEPMPVSLPRQL